ncbi:PAS domain-containing protein [uncultured Algimonas sp.]|uniref:PAS domain-containing protein n=1 Tax=uncultured Algimonas sp. TaxID=1547920 RepID=UPI002613FBD9|nr:PAS domain-containing protein [uncultured Algimonas sp.]
MSGPTVVRPSAFHSPVRKTRLLLASLPIFAGLLSEDGQVLECNFGPLGGPLEDRTDWIGRPFEHGPWWDYSEGSRAAILIMLGRAKNGHPASEERLYRKPNSDMGVMALTLTPLFAPYGQPDAILVTAVDVTERRRETDTADHIAHDMAHRLRNSFTIMRTLATRADPDEAAHLSRRLSRVRDSHSLSYRYLFFDVPIQDLVEATIDDRSQLTRYEFDPVGIPAEHAETLMLALGELALPGHKAELVAQRIGADRLTLHWTESAPRPEADMPQGLSHVLLKTVPEQKMQGTVTIDNGSSGFSWYLDFPLQTRDAAETA